MLFHRTQNPLQSLGEPVKQTGEDERVLAGVYHPAGRAGIEGLVQRHALNHVGSLKLIERGAVQTVTALGQ